MADSDAPIAALMKNRISQDTMKNMLHMGPNISQTTGPSTLTPQQQQQLQNTYSSQLNNNTPNVDQDIFNTPPISNDPIIDRIIKSRPYYFEGGGPMPSSSTGNLYNQPSVADQSNSVPDPTTTNVPPSSDQFSGQYWNNLSRARTQGWEI